MARKQRMLSGAAGDGPAGTGAVPPHAGVSRRPDRGVRRAVRGAGGDASAAICCRSAATRRSPTICSQDTFLQMHRSRRTYEPGRPVTPWVFAIARHVYLMKRRAHGATAAVRGDGWPPTRDRTTTTHDAARAMRERGRSAARAARRASRSASGAADASRARAGASSEIATRLGIRVNAAKTRAFRGMRRLRGHLR